MRRSLLFLSAAALLAASANPVFAACCYFSAQNTDILQPAQKVFITWDPEKKAETFTVQPKFEGNALDFGMVIPTPTQPKLHEMPRDFFRSMAFYTVLKQREFPTSKILPRIGKGKGAGGGKAKGKGKAADDAKGVPDEEPPPRPPIIILETGVVGSLDYKIIDATRADALFKWLKDNKYHYAGDEATLDHYIQKKWIFTVMKIDTMQMKKNKDGRYDGEVTPTRFQFESEKLVYPLKITQISVKDKTEALFYVQAPFKADLEGDMTYQYTWVPMLMSSNKFFKSGKGVAPPPNLPGKATEWLMSIQDQIPGLLQKSSDLGFNFVRNQRPTPNAQGRTPTTMEWARKLTADDLKILTGQMPYSDKIPNVDEGFTIADYQEKPQAVAAVIRDRIARAQQEKPNGYLTRHVPNEELKGLAQLAGHLTEGLFITKFRKIFTRGEMNDDLVLVAARYGQQTDRSEYEEILPASPP